MATPSVLTFDAEGRAIEFEVWVDALQLFLQCDRADGLSLFDLTSGASPAPAADGDATVWSQWATRDAVARLAMRHHLPTAERAHFSLRSARRLPLAGDAAQARARGARALEELAGAVEAAVEMAEGVAVVVGVVAGVGALVAAVEAEKEAMVAVRAEVAEVEAVVEVAAAEVELVGAALRRGSAPVVRGGGAGPCTYDLRTGDRAGEQCGGPHSTQRCFGRLTYASRHPFPNAIEIPRWGELFRAGVAIFDLHYDAILAAMYAVTISDEGDCYRCFPPDPGIKAAALGAGEAAALGASESTAPGAGESALSGTASALATYTFTLDSGASRSFF
ncbi:unnamed protein product [Closterium sp. NIES-65]|nr:unnamed protein product [Closterium sp. NIES-65]